MYVYFEKRLRVRF